MGLVGELRPYERSRFDEHEKVQRLIRSVPAPPGALMVAPPEVPRNAEGRKAKAAPRRMGVKRGL